MVSAVSSLTNAFSGLWDSFKKGDLTGIISGFVAVGYAIKTLSSLTVLQNGVDIISFAIKKKLTSATVAQTAATEAQAAANKALLASLGPIGAALAVIAVVAAAVLTAILAITTIQKKMRQEQHEQEIENLKLEEQQQELINSTQELSDKVHELADAYKELKGAGKDTFDTTEELKQRMPELIDLYTKLGLSVQGLQAAYYSLINGTGSIDAVVDEINKLDAAVAREKQVSAKRGMESAARSMAYSDDARGEANGSTYTAKFNG